MIIDEQNLCLGILKNFKKFQKNYIQIHGT